MPSLIEGDDRQTVKRTVPKSSNKILAAAVVKLYVSLPDRPKWTYTGLQGAAVLANDLVGNTFWVKLVDISGANRGVIWDQEIYDTFQYNQDRVFFHSFELENCMAGFSFANDKEARKFKQKMDEREKSAHKNTRSKPFGNVSGQVSNGPQQSTKSHGILGGFGSFLHRDRANSGQHQQMHSIIPPQEVAISSNGAPNKGNNVEDIDPALLDELLAMGITEDQLAENADFIKMWVEQKNASATAGERKQKAPPPAPPTISPQDTGERRCPPPALPQSRRPPPPSAPSPQELSRSATPEPASPPAGAKRWNFRAPPPLEGAGKFAADAKRAPSPRRAQPTLAPASNGPDPPPRPPKTPLQDGDTDGPKFAVPPPFEGGGRSSNAPPPPPRGSQGPPAPPPRGGAVPAPPPRDSQAHAVPPPPPRETHGHPVPPPFSGPPPPLPPKANDTISSGPPPPPPSRTPRGPPSLPNRDSAGPLSPPPPALPSRDRVSPPPPALPSRDAISPPAPPPPPRTSGPPPPPLPSGGAPPPPPPPPPSTGGPPPPPPPPPAMPAGEAATANAPPLPKAGGGGRDGLLADIRGGARLKKVSDAEKRDRSAAMVPGGEASVPAGGSAAAPAAGGGGEGGLAGALASALAARKSKVSQSDDEDDKDDW